MKMRLVRMHFAGDSVMATLRDMLVKIYRPQQGIIEYGPGGSTQDGATDLAVLGGGPNQGDGGAGGGGGGIDFPDFRYAGVEGGAAGGAGGFDLSSIDWSDPGQVEMARNWLQGQSREGGQAGEPGGPGRDLGPLSAESIESALGGYSTIGGLFGTLLGVPGLGLIGSGIDTFNDYQRADEFDPEYSPELLDVLSAFGYDLTSGALGSSMHSDAIGGYQDRSGTRLNEAALGAATGGTGTSYSGPKGVVGPRPAGGSGGGVAESSSYGGLSAASRGAYQGGAGSYSGPKGVVGRQRDRNRDLGGRGGEAGGRGGGRGPGGGPGGQSSGSDPGGWRHEGGPIYGDPGEEVEITALAGEHVMSPEAVEMFGPETFEKINDLAGMMRQQHYPARKSPGGSPLAKMRSRQANARA